MPAKSSIVFQLVSAGFICALIIKIVTVYTDPYIAKNAGMAEKRAVLDIFNIQYDSNTIDHTFTKKIETVTLDNGNVYKFLSCVAFKLKGSGFWGKIEALIALEPDLKTIRALTIISHNETPGLGARITEPDFLAGFQGKILNPDIKIKKNAEGINEIDAITGATQTSKALEQIINTELSKYFNRKDKWYQK